MVEEEVEVEVVEEECLRRHYWKLEYWDSSLVHSTQVRKGKFHSLHNYKYKKQEVVEEI